MKTVGCIGLMAALGLSGGAWGQTTTQDDLFATTGEFRANAASVHEVNMNADDLKMVEGKDSAEARKLVLEVVHTYTYKSPGAFRHSVVDVYRNKLSGSNWHCTVHSQDFEHGRFSDICTRVRPDNYLEKAVVNESPLSLTFIHRISKP